MAGRPDYKVMISQKGAGGNTFYKEVGVAWKSETRDKREKISITLHMFPGANFYCFPNETEEETKARFEKSGADNPLEATGENQF